MTKRGKRPTEPAVGWGLRVGGIHPYLAWALSFKKADLQKECTESYHRPVRVVLLPLAAAQKAGLLKRKKGTER
jgi:hypothetical protein